MLEFYDSNIVYLIKCIFKSFNYKIENILKKANVYYFDDHSFILTIKSIKFYMGYDLI